jgi:hypothetical protein
MDLANVIDLELGFRQSSVHHIMQVLRVCDFLRLFFTSRFTAVLFSLVPFGSG